MYDSGRRLPCMFDHLTPPLGLAKWLGLKLMPPAIEWGSPVQRAKGESESFWHIPVSTHPGRPWSVWPRKWGPASVPACEISLQKFDGQTPGQFRLCWGDAFFGEPTTITSLRLGHTVLVPIAFRSEGEEGGKAYWAEQ